MRFSKISIVSITLSLSLGTSLFAGCGDKTEPQQNASGGSQTKKENITFPLKEPVTMTLFGHSNPNQELSNTVAMKEMEKKTNVKWEYTLFSSNEIKEKLSLSFAGGKYYDVYMKSDMSYGDASKYGKDGFLIPLQDLIASNMPNLKSLLDSRNAWKEITSIDGNVYSFPQMNGAGLVTLSLFINEKWLKAVNREMPKSIDEYVDTLRDFKKKDPNGNGKADEIPLYLPAGSMETTMQYFGIPFDGNTMSTYDSKSGKITYYPTSDKYKEFLKVMRTIYEEGLCNENCFSATWDELSAKGSTEDVIGAFPQWGAYLIVGTEKDEDWPALVPFNKGDICCSSGVFYGGLSITDKCKYPEIVASWTDYLYSEEGGILAWMGVEGETYKSNTDGTYEWLTDKGYGTDITTIRNTQTIFGNVPAPCVAPKYFSDGQTNPEEIYLLGQRRMLEGYFAEPFPALTWTEEELKEKSTLVSSINPFVSQYEASVVIGEKNLDSDWDAYVKALKEMGSDRLNEIDQGAYTRFLQGK